MCIIHHIISKKESNIFPPLFMKGALNSIRHSIIQKGEQEQQNRPKIYFSFFSFLAQENKEQNCNFETWVFGFC